MSNRSASNAGPRKAPRTARTKSIDYEEEDPSKIADMLDRRRMQNRISQRNYRNKIRSKLEKLEALLGPEAAAELDNPSSTKDAIVSHKRSSASLDDGNSGAGQQPSGSSTARHSSNPSKESLSLQQAQPRQQLDPASPYADCDQDPDCTEPSALSPPSHQRASSSAPMDMSGLSGPVHDDLLHDLGNFGQLDTPLDADWTSLLHVPPPAVAGVDDLQMDEPEAPGNAGSVAAVSMSMSSPPSSVPVLYPDQFTPYAWPGISPMVYSPSFLAGMPSVRPEQLSWPSPGSSTTAATTGSAAATPANSSPPSDASSPCAQQSQPQQQQQQQQQQQPPARPLSALSLSARDPAKASRLQQQQQPHLQAPLTPDMSQAAWAHPALHRYHSTAMGMPMQQPLMFMMVPVSPPTVAHLSGAAAAAGMGQRVAPGPGRAAPQDGRSWGLTGF